MGGKGSGGARPGAGRKKKPPKKIETRGRKKGEVRIGAGAHRIGTEKRVTLNAMVDVSTMESLADIQREENVSRGMAIDRAVRHYTEHKAETATE